MLDYLDPTNLLSILMGPLGREYLSQAGKRRPITIKLNPLKANPANILSFLHEEGFLLRPLPHYDLAYEVEHEPYPLTKSIIHFAGLIYLQDPSSMLPPILLDPRPGEVVLDLTAAPGSKTTLLSTLMENKGAVVAIDNSGKRLQALSYNLERWGVINTGWGRGLAEQIGNIFFECFDKVLVDPPCTGLGTLHKSPEILRWWKGNKVIKLSRIQERILISGLKALKPRGTLVYSTCTLTPHENEGVVNAILERYPVVLEEIKIKNIPTHPGLVEFINFRFNEELSKAIRIYPLEQEGEGFFIAKLKKMEAFSPPRYKSLPQEHTFFLPTDLQIKERIEEIKRHFGLKKDPFPHTAFFLLKRHARIASIKLAGLSSPIPLQRGLSFAHTLKGGWRLTTRGIQWLAPIISENFIELDSKSLRKLLSGHTLCEVSGHGQQLLTHLGCPLGYGLIKNGQLISQIPSKELIIRE